MKKLVATLAILAFTLPYSAFAAATLADTPNIGNSTTGGASQNPSISYTIPAGTNQVLWLFVSGDNTVTPTADWNGSESFTIVPNFVTGRCNLLATSYLAYRINPTTGTHNIVYHKGAATVASINYFTTNGTDQTTPLDAYYCTQGIATPNSFTSTTTPSANDLLMAYGFENSGNTGSSHGAGQTEFINVDDGVFFRNYGSYVQGSSTPTTLQGMSENWTGSVNNQLQMIAVKAAASAAVAPVVRPLSRAYWWGT